MPIVNRTNTFIGDTDAKASEVNQDFDKLYNVINGDLDELNLNLERKDLQLALLEALKLVDGDGSGLDAEKVIGKSYETIKKEIYPPGIISMWSGAIDDIPSEWTLCDGTNGTPNLTDRFIVGAGSSYSVGNTGGTSQVALSESQIPSHNHSDGSLGTDTDGWHNHNIDANGKHNHSGSTDSDTHNHSYSYDAKNGNYGFESGGDYNFNGTSGTTSNDTHNHSIGTDGYHNHNIDGAGNHSHDVTGSTGSTGGDGSHENRPPYYALAYIMKL